MDTTSTRMRVAPAIVAFLLGAFTCRVLLVAYQAQADASKAHITTSLYSAAPQKFAVMTWQSILSRRPTMRNTVDGVRQGCETSREDVDCRVAMFSLDLLRISRLFNPGTRFYLLADAQVLQNNTYYRDELENLHLDIRYSADYRRPGSRAALYDSYHYGTQGQDHPPEMLSRFCEMADLAKQEGIERILTADADIGLFSTVEALLHVYPEDVVTPCPQCSQLVLWSTKALDAYCDGLISFWRLNDTDRNALYAKYQTENTFNDMHFLWMFIEENNTAWAHNFSSVILTRETPSPRNPYPNFWGAAATAMTLKPDMRYPSPEWYNTNCDKFLELVKFAAIASTSPLVVPVLADLNLPLPIIHFHQMCKLNVVHRMFIDHYRKWYFLD